MPIEALRSGEVQTADLVYDDCYEQIVGLGNVITFAEEMEAKATLTATSSSPGWTVHFGSEQELPVLGLGQRRPISTQGLRHCGPSQLTLLYAPSIMAPFAQRQ